MIGALARSMPRSCCVPVIELQTGRPREVIGIAGAGESDRDGLGPAEDRARDHGPELKTANAIVMKLGMDKTAIVRSGPASPMH
jgi:hypothetical protein